MDMTQAWEFVDSMMGVDYGYEVGVDDSGSLLCE